MEILFTIISREKVRDPVLKTALHTLIDGPEYAPGLYYSIIFIVAKLKIANVM